MRYASAALILSLFTSGCVYIELQGGIAAGAAEPTDVSVGPVIALAVGVHLTNIEQGFASGVGISGAALGLEIDNLEELAFISGVSGFVEVPIEIGSRDYALVWSVSLSAGGGFIRRGGVLEESGGGTLQTGFGMIFRLSNQTTLAATIGPYGAFLTTPGAFGGVDRAGRRGPAQGDRGPSGHRVLDRGVPSS